MIQISTKKILAQFKEGLVNGDEGKGRGVVSTRNFTGECISEEEAKGRETAFLEDPDTLI